MSCTSWGVLSTQFSIQCHLRAREEMKVRESSPSTASFECIVQAPIKKKVYYS